MPITMDYAASTSCSQVNEVLPIIAVMIDNRDTLLKKHKGQAYPAFPRCATAMRPVATSRSEYGLERRRNHQFLDKWPKYAILTPPQGTGRVLSESTSTGRSTWLSPHLVGNHGIKVRGREDFFRT